MSTEIIVAVITGIVTILATCITVAAGMRKSQQAAAVQQAITDTKLEALTEEVRRHNDFARRIPVLEEKIDVANHRIADLEAKEK